MKRIVEFMKRNYKVILLITALSAVLWSFIPSEKKEDSEKDKLLLELLAFVLERGHYSPIEMNDEFSKKVYAKYLDNIDPTKRFFIQSDIDEFQKYETLIDDMVKNKDLTFFNLTYERLLKRMKEAREIYVGVLDKPFDFNQKETINVDYEKMPFAKNKSELKDRWRKQLKLQALSSITDKEKLEFDKKEKDPKAERIASMTHGELSRMAAQTDMKAGSRSPVDPLAAKIIERSRIPTSIVLGRNIENLKKGALGGHTGTEIRRE